MTLQKERSKLDHARSVPEVSREPEVEAETAPISGPSSAGGQAVDLVSPTGGVNIAHGGGRIDDVGAALPRLRPTGRGRHVAGGKLKRSIARSLNPTAFFQWMLVLCLALVLWPAVYGGAFGMVIVAGNSMEPTYDLGDAVVTWRQPVEVGDAILFRVPEGDVGEGNPVIHRVVGRDADGWITQGDNSARPDKWRPSSNDVLGVAQFYVPLGGRLLALMRSWLFIALLGGVAVGLLLWPESKDDEPPSKGRHKKALFSRSGR